MNYKKTFCIQYHVICLLVTEPNVLNQLKLVTEINTEYVSLWNDSVAERYQFFSGNSLAQILTDLPTLKTDAGLDLVNYEVIYKSFTILNVHISKFY